MFLPVAGDTTHHGYPIIDVRYGNSDPICEGILIALRADSPHPYVVWRFSAETGVTYSGGYYKTLPEAIADMNNRPLI